MNTGRDLVLTKIKETFPHENPENVLAALDLYGGESYEREHERVQLAILKLSHGSMDELLSKIEVAKQDYRDVLACAEYPHEMTRSADEMHRMPADEAQSIRDKDRQQYLEWLDKSMGTNLS
jgi:hypothetical protein